MPYFGVNQSFLQKIHYFHFYFGIVLLSKKNSEKSFVRFPEQSNQGFRGKFVTNMMHLETMCFYSKIGLYQIFPNMQNLKKKSL